jgi:hypothetical protein
MKNYRPFWFCLLLYEFFRLLALVLVVGGTAPQEDVFPWLVYGAANALFLFMVLFLWLDTSWYRPYIPLYTAGKILSVFSTLGWFFFTRDRIILTIREGNPDILILLGSMLGIAGVDLLSAAGGAALGQKLKEWEPPKTTAETGELPAKLPSEDGGL